MFGGTTGVARVVGSGPVRPKRFGGTKTGRCKGVYPDELMECIEQHMQLSMELGHTNFV